MTATTEQILNQALALDDSERAELTERLWESIEPQRPADDLSDAQKSMLDQRWEDIVSGKVKCLSHEEVMTKLKAKYAL
jgi:putative addiction module component (TIGR02574 family)